jgi:hypothetical protein
VVVGGGSVGDAAGGGSVSGVVVGVALDGGVVDGVVDGGVFVGGVVDGVALDEGVVNGAGSPDAAADEGPEPSVPCAEADNDRSRASASMSRR